MAANYTRIIEHKGHLPQEELIYSSAIRLCEIDKIYGKGVAKNFVIAYLINFCDLLNIKEDAKLNEIQLSTCALNILMRCNGITISELADMIRKFSSGRYGQFYGQMDIMTIGEWTMVYMKDRGDIILNNDQLTRFILERDK
ncbi:hypothetical protein KEM09_05145 [Carboxylicivirga mesophila]|uniref:Uncharacterized protein n=2 Tax=Carboxylicivirga TaxID=1628153 RepID=A0A941F466_9BACT|nr:MULTISPECIES: hypothetical protein [Carboxylicivirga]MBR8536094.1 hypothetical protein [Carboxylicivirga sediminis]MBS2210772.1 hypothetical protein [Carboxylicivirga mesophila]